MRSLLALGVAALIVSPALATAATCPDIAAPALVSPAGAAAAKCLSTIAKGATGFVKAKMSTEGKCLSQQDPFACPNAKDDEKIQKAAVKAQDKIAAACGDDAVQAALGSAYGAISDETRISSCVLGQHNATLGVMVGVSNGAPGPYSGDPGRLKCVGALGGIAAKMVTSIMKTVNKCVDGQVKAGTPGDLGPVCVGSWVGGVYVPPTDAKAASKIASAMTKAEGSIDKSCGALADGQVQSIFACNGAANVAGLKNCLVCENWSGVTDLAEQQYAENATTFVDNGPGALAAAVGAAASGDKLLIESGTYEETVNITTDGLQLVGCGAATNDRPQIQPPPMGVNPNGLFAANVDGLVFQGLKVFDWDENGIFVTGADGVTFRDIEGDGNVNSLYAVFPVESNNVLVEACHVTAVADAGIYVGSSTNIVVRYNRVDKNVAGLEIENSGNAEVYNNLAVNNTGGILVFKLPGPPLQISENHDVHHNVSVENNTPNFGAPGSTVGLIPDGTGMFIISNDTSLFHHNYLENNGSFGMVLIDQEGINALAGAGTFDPTSVDQTVFSNLFENNNFVDNGFDPDTTPPNTSGGLSADFIMVLGDEQGGNHENCFSTNGQTANNAFNALFLTASDCD